MSSVGHLPVPGRRCIQVEDRAELEEVYARLQRAEGRVLAEGETTCCYARSEKGWIEHPQSIPWETFLTFGESSEPALIRLRDWRGHVPSSWHRTFEPPAARGLLAARELRLDRDRCHFGTFELQLAHCPYAWCCE